MRLKIRNLNEDFKRDMESGIGFIIDRVDAIKANGERCPSGIFSPLYGINEDKKDRISLYECECGKLKGKFNTGVVCKKCGTKVKENKDIMDRTGWMVLDDKFCLIHPIIYNNLQKLIGAKKLKDIIKYENDIDENGNIIEQEYSSPHYNKGMLYLRDNIIQIMEDLGKQDRKENKQFILDNLDKAFINKIPVYSLILRDILKIGELVISNDINKKYNNLLGDIIVLNNTLNDIDNSEIKYLPFLQQAQDTLMELNKLIEGKVATKAGLIRDNIMGREYAHVKLF